MNGDGSTAQSHEAEASGSEVGVVTVDPDGAPLSVNTAALRILFYPDAGTAAQVYKRLAKLFGSSFPPCGTRGKGGSVRSFLSGRRRYLCRHYPLPGRPSQAGAPAAIVVLEREPQMLLPPAVDLAAFRLTEREQQVLRCVVNGLSNRRIGQKLGISPNTVKAFLRLIMMKMGVSSRLGILGKLLANRTADVRREERSAKTHVGRFPSGLATRV